MSACTTCGACCVAFRVDFSVHETESAGGSVPDGLWVPVTDHIARMRGTDHGQPRCAALCGTIGHTVTCAIYPWRPNPCREFAESSAACLRARRQYRLD